MSIDRPMEPAELVKAAVRVEDYWSEDSVEPKARVTVYVGHKISGEKLTVQEAVRFIRAMQAAGYDLVEMAKEFE